MSNNTVNSKFERVYVDPWNRQRTVTVYVEDGRATLPEEWLHFMAMHAGFIEVVD